MTRFFSLVFLFGFLVSMVFHSPSYAQISTDPSDPTAVGFSTSRARLKKSNWHVSGSTSIVRGLDYYANFFQQQSLSGIYNLGKYQNLSFGIAYTHPTDSEVTFPEDFGFEDAAVSYTRRNIFTPLKKLRTDLRVNLGVPTSRVSQRSSLKGSVSFSLPTSLVWKKINFVMSPGISYSQYEFDVADTSGRELNFPVALPLGFVVSKRFFRKFIAATSFGWIQLFDASRSSILIQRVSINLTAPLGQGFALTGGYSWRDRRLSNLSLFDDDTSRYFLSLSFYK